MWVPFCQECLQRSLKHWGEACRRPVVLPMHGDEAIDKRSQVWRCQSSMHALARTTARPWLCNSIVSHHDATLCEHFLPDMTVPALRIANGRKWSCVIPAAVTAPVLATTVLLCSVSRHSCTMTVNLSHNPMRIIMLLEQ